MASLSRLHRLASRDSKLCSWCTMSVIKRSKSSVPEAEGHTLEQKSSQSSHNVAPPKFDYALIRSLKPFPAWLEGEMRSNHAGETGAVNIYAGAKWALEARKSLSR